MYNLHLRFIPDITIVPRVSWLACIPRHWHLLLAARKRSHCAIGRNYSTKLITGHCRPGASINAQSTNSVQFACILTESLVKIKLGRLRRPGTKMWG